MSRYVLAANRSGQWHPLDQHPGSPHTSHPTLSLAYAAARPLLTAAQPRPLAIIDVTTGMPAWTFGDPPPGTDPQLDLFG